MTTHPLRRVQDLPVAVLDLEGPLARLQAIIAALPEPPAPPTGHPDQVPQPLVQAWTQLVTMAADNLSVSALMGGLGEHRLDAMPTHPYRVLLALLQEMTYLIGRRALYEVPK
jgi:hypothetical protein